MDNRKHYLSLSIILLLQEIIFLVPLVQSGDPPIIGKATTQLPFPCFFHTQCWLYCQAFGQQLQGTGCCYPKKFSAENGDLVKLPGLNNVCYCCLGVKVVLDPGTIDKFCDTVNPIVSGVTDFIDLFTGNLCLANKKLNVKCSLVQVESLLSIVDILGDCDSNNDITGGALTPVLNIIG